MRRASATSSARPTPTRSWSATARFLRGLIPGGEPETSEMPEAMQRLVEEVQPQGPSAMREIGKGALQAWQALSEAQRRRAGTRTSRSSSPTWSGSRTGRSRPAMRLPSRSCARSGDAEQKAISSNKGAVVKRLGDGAMAVFSDAGQAVSAALDGPARDLGDRGRGIQADSARRSPQGHASQGEGRLPRASTSTSPPGSATAAKGGEVLVSEPVREELDGRRFKFGASRELDAPGAPAELTVCSVTSRRRG